MSQDFAWGPSPQSYILSSFFWGYIVTQLPASYIAHTWGPTKLWTTSMLVCGVVNLIIPTAAEMGGWIAVCVCRIIMGLSQGGVYSSAHTLLGKWIPPEERARLGKLESICSYLGQRMIWNEALLFAATYAYAGAQFGTVIGLAVSGFLAASPIGWPSIFYVVGVLAIIWSAAFHIWSDDSPSHHRSITTAERNYIERSLGQVDVRKASVWCICQHSAVNQ